MTFMDKLNATQNLSDNERQILTYIKAHLNAAAQMTSQELAAVTFTSHSVIVRLAKKLGYPGYRAMHEDLIKEVQARLLQPKAVDANFPMHPGDSAMTVAKHIADLTTNTIQTALTQLEAADLAQAAQLIESAKRIFIFASGDSQIRALSFQNKLSKIGLYPVIADEYNDADWVATGLTPDDLAIFLSYSGNGDSNLRIANRLGQSQTPQLVLTGNAKSRLLTHATCALVVTQKESALYKVSTFASQISFEYLLDTLFAIIYGDKYQTHVGKLMNDLSTIHPQR